MEFQEVRYFLALCDTLNFTRASERCNVSQPALTRAIRNLEGKLGGALVHRERGNTHLTELGRIMQPYFRQVIGQMDEARRRARALVRLDASTLRIGLMCTIGPQRLVDLFSGFVRGYKGVEIYLKDAPASALEEVLAKGEIDVAIFCRPGDLDDDRFHSLALYRERFVIGIGPGHPFERLNAVRVKDLHQQNYLARANCEYYDYLRGVREQVGGVELKRPYTSERDDWIQCMVVAGLGFTYIPEFAATVPGLLTRPLVEPEVYRTVSLVTVRGRPHSPAVGAFMREAKRYPWGGPALAKGGDCAQAAGKAA
jgi:DNA-binding transcriptional LysR family regulator